MKKNIRILYLIGLLQGMVFYGPIATLYRQAQGVNIAQITIIESISLVLCLLLEIPWGVVADKIGYKRTMVFCCGLYFVSKLVFWQATGFAGFLVERVMLSVIIAGMSGVDTSILYLSCEEGESQKAFGVYDSLSTGGLLIAAVVFSVCIGENYKLAGGLTAVAYGIAAAASLGLTEVKAKEARRISFADCKAILRQTLGNKRLLLFLVGVGFLSEAHQTITVFLNQLQYQRCGLSSASIGYIYVAITLLGMCGAWSARITRRLGTRLSAGLFYGAAFAACVALALTGRAALSIGSIAVLRVCNSLFQPMQMELQNQQVRTAHRATALSVNAMLVESVGVGTNLVFGALAEYSLPAAFFFGAGLCAVGLLLFRCLRPAVSQ